MKAPTLCAVLKGVKTRRIASLAGLVHLTRLTQESRYDLMATVLESPRGKSYLGERGNAVTRGWDNQANHLAGVR